MFRSELCPELHLKHFCCFPLSIGKLQEISIKGNFPERSHDFYLLIVMILIMECLLLISEQLSA